jgi:hypothetical protein
MQQENGRPFAPNHIGDVDAVDACRLSDKSLEHRLASL